MLKLLKLLRDVMSLGFIMNYERKKHGTAQQVALTLAQPLCNMHKMLPSWQKFCLYLIAFFASENKTHKQGNF